MNNTIELPVAELKTALTGLGKIIPKSGPLPVLQSLHVSRNRQGTVILQATDLDACVLYQAPTQTPGPVGEFLVPFAPLNQAVKGGTERVELISEGNTKVRLKAYLGQTPIEQSIESLPVEEYPSAPRMEDPGSIVDRRFRDTLRQALDCCGTDCSRAMLHNVCLDVTQPRAHYVVATNASHLYCANSFTFDLKQSVLLPDQRFLRWNGFMEEGEILLGVKPATKRQAAWVQLKAGPWTFIAKQTEGPFPQWKQILPLPERQKTVLQFQPEAVAALLTIVPQLPSQNEKDQPVQLVVEPDGFKVRGRSKDASDWSEVPIQHVHQHGPPVSVMLNREYLLKALRFRLHTLEVESELEKVEFHAEGRRMIVMPLRPSEAKPSVKPPTPPPASSPEAQPQERKPMPRTISTPPSPETAHSPESPMKSVLQRMDVLRDRLRGLLKELAETADLLKQAEKERKASDREVEAVRGKLREIQSVKL